MQISKLCMKPGLLSQRGASLSLSYLVEVSLQVYGPAALKAGVCVLHQEEMVGHFLSQTQLSTPHLPQWERGEHGRQQPSGGAGPLAPKQGHSGKQSLPANHIQGKEFK